MPGGKGGQDIDFGVKDIHASVPTLSTGGFRIGSELVGRKGHKGVHITGGATDERSALVRNLSNAFGDRADEYGALRSELKPGFGRLTTSRLNELEDDRKRRVGNLAQQLSRRRVLGSNFARDEISREELAFTRERDRITAESTLAEIAATIDLVGQEYSSRAQQFQTFIDDLNLEAQIGMALATGAQQTYAALQQQAIALESASKTSSAGGINSIFGNILGQGTQAGFSHLAASPQGGAGGGGGAAPPAGGAT